MGDIQRSICNLFASCVTKCGQQIQIVKHERGKRFRARECYCVELFWSLFGMPRRSQIKPQKWLEMRRVYIAGNVTLKELSRLYGVGYSTVRRYASANNWFAHKRSRTVLVEAEARNSLSERLLKEAGRLQQTAPHCIPMPASQHYNTLIRLLHLNLKLKQQMTPQQDSSQPDNIIPLRQTRRTSVTRASLSQLT